ncbi:MAG: hypothetical protein ABIT71_24720 [Vicinamibacteraceae bacterium]
MTHAATSAIRSGSFTTAVDADGFPVLPPTLLTIHRTSTRDEQTRQIICALDGKRFGQVLFGQRLTIEILPGAHSLRVHNTLMWKTAAFEAEPGGHVHFTVWNRGWGEAYYLMIVFVGAAPLGVGLARGTPEELDAAARRSGP